MGVKRQKLNKIVMQNIQRMTVEWGVIFLKQLGPRVCLSACCLGLSFIYISENEHIKKGNAAVVD